MENALTTAEKKDLVTCEEQIEQGMHSFIEVGNALVRIRDGGLYKESHPTFESYLKERWGMTRSRAYQLIDSADVVENVNHGGQKPPILPTCERQARVLAKLEEAEQQQEVWAQAVGQHGEHVTAAKVRSTAKELYPDLFPTPKKKEEAKAEPPAEEEGELTYEAKKKLSATFGKLVRDARKFGVTHKLKGLSWSQIAEVLLP